MLSDYLKGVVSRAIGRPRSRPDARGIPLLVDPKVPHVDYYAGATLITPNHHEAEAVAHMRIRSTDEARDAARRVPRARGCENVLITRGEHGMWLLRRTARPTSPPKAREVADVTGAGDTVIGTMALALAAGGADWAPRSPIAPPGSSSASSGRRRSLTSSSFNSINNKN